MPFLRHECRFAHQSEDAVLSDTGHILPSACLSTAAVAASFIVAIGVMVAIFLVAAAVGETDELKS